MSEWKSSKIAKPAAFYRQRRSSFFRPAVLFSPIAILIVLLIFPARGYLQTGSTFASKPIIDSVQDRFKLSKKELAGISPLIKQDNIEVLSIYARYGGREPDYSDRLWQAIIALRIDFEHRVGLNLNNRQKLALKAARTALEDRVLNLVVDDFVYSIEEFLELNVFETNAVQDIFYSDYTKKHRLIVKQFNRMSVCQQGLEAISEDTEGRMRSVLSPSQFREYKSLTTPVDTLIGGV